MLARLAWKCREVRPGAMASINASLALTKSPLNRWALPRLAAITGRRNGAVSVDRRESPLRVFDGVGYVATKNSNGRATGKEQTFQVLNSSRFYIRSLLHPIDGLCGHMKMAFGGI